MMDEKTREALEGSIEKWRGIVAGTEIDRGATNCPLCIMFNDEDAVCDGCPVKERTGFDQCRNTPYDDYYGQTSVAQEELGFLISLRPVEETER